jgi:hypothetical protein
MMTMGSTDAGKFVNGEWNPFNGSFPPSPSFIRPSGKANSLCAGISYQGLSPVKGIVQTAIHFEKNDDSDIATKN